MEQKLVKVPFDVEMAKKIMNGEVEGKIFDDYYKCYVRIVDFNFQSNVGKLNISISEKGEGKEIYSVFNDDGVIYLDRDGEFDDKPTFVLEIPEYMSFKDGDVVGFGSGSVGIFQKIDLGGDTFSSYATLCGNTLIYYEPSWRLSNSRKATEEEKQKLIDALKASKEPKAKECLKMLGVEERQECEFKPFDKVLVRDEGGIWFADIFSHYTNDSEWEYKTAGGGSWEQCIPYNEKTAHLLGTTGNWEE